jgi:hypothetical protein
MRITLAFQSCPNRNPGSRNRIDNRCFGEHAMTAKKPKLYPGDQAGPGTPGAGENICLNAKDRKLGPKDCPICGGREWSSRKSAGVSNRAGSPAAASSSAVDVLMVTAPEGFGYPYRTTPRAVPRSDAYFSAIRPRRTLSTWFPKFRFDMTYVPSWNAK